MKKLIIATLTTLIAVSAQAKDACFTFDNGDPAALTLYKVKVAKVRKGQSVRLSGVAVMPDSPQALTVEGAAIGLTNGHINYYFTAYGYDGKPVAEPAYGLFANQPSYSGTYSPNLTRVACDDFPQLRNL